MSASSTTGIIRPRLLFRPCGRSIPLRNTPSRRQDLPGGRCSPRPCVIPSDPLVASAARPIPSIGPAFVEPCSSSSALGCPGGICPHNSARGTRSTNASTGGPPASSSRSSTITPNWHHTIGALQGVHVRPLHHHQFFLIHAQSRSHRQTIRPPRRPWACPQNHEVRPSVALPLRLRKRQHSDDHKPYGWLTVVGVSGSGDLEQEATPPMDGGRA
jgi:hypothetical protein